MDSLIEGTPFKSIEEAGVSIKEYADDIGGTEDIMNESKFYLNK